MCYSDDEQLSSAVPGKDKISIKDSTLLIKVSRDFLQIFQVTPELKILNRPQFLILQSFPTSSTNLT
jgi:hypothetical protein